MFKVYIAAPYSMKDTIKQYAGEFQEAGVGVTCSWVNEPHKPTTQMSDLTPAEHQAYAVQDVEDVASADALVFLTDPTGTIVRAGRHVEFGMAVMMNRMSQRMGLGPVPILVVGEQFENIFHHLPNVSHFANWELAKAAVLEIKQKFEVAEQNF